MSTHTNMEIARSVSTTPLPATASYSSHPAYGGRGSIILGSAWSLGIVALILVVLRQVTWLTLAKGGGGWSTNLATAGWLCGLVALITATIAVINGIGNHAIFMDQYGTYTAAYLPFWIMSVSIGYSLSISKLSVIAFVLDVQGRTHRAMRWLLYFIGISTLLVYTAFLFVVFFQCSPPAALWDLSIPGNCVKGQRSNIIMAYFAGGWETASDLFLALYPTFLISNLTIKPRLKLGLCVLLGLGILSAACSLAKTLNYRVLSSSHDISFDVVPLVCWGFAEMWTVLIASSVAPIWPLVRRGAANLSRLGNSASRQTSHSSDTPLARVREGTSAQAPVTGPDNQQRQPDPGFNGLQSTDRKYDIDRVLELP